MFGGVGERELYMKNLQLIGCIAFLGATTVSHSEEISGSAFYSGAWSGAAYTEDDTGKWSHCAILASYEHNGFDLIISLDNQYDLGIGLSNPTDPVFSGHKELQIVAKVDNFDPMFATAQVIDDFFAGVWFDDLDAAMLQIAKGNLLTLSSKIGTETFGLEGTYKALNETYACARAYQNFATVPEVEQQPSDLNAWNPTAEETAAMYQISSKIISDLRLENFMFLTGEDNFISGGKGVMWEAREGQILGGVFVGRERGALDLQQIMSEDIATLSKLCADGDLALINSKYLVDGVSTVQVKGVCDSLAEPFNLYLTKQNINEVLVETLIFDYEKSSAEGSYDPDMGKNAAIISVNYLNK